MFCGIIAVITCVLFLTARESQTTNSLQRFIWINDRFFLLNVQPTSLGESDRHLSCLGHPLSPRRRKELARYL